LKHKKRKSKGLKFVIIIVLSIIVTIFLANHFASIFFGKNSIEVYTSLKNQKAHLQKEIKNFQHKNARLQKEYFELKNLEPVQ
jgi:cell division protein FtsB